MESQPTFIPFIEALKTVSLKLSRKCPKNNETNRFMIIFVQEELFIIYFYIYFKLTEMDCCQPTLPHSKSCVTLTQAKEKTSLAQKKSSLRFQRTFNPN